jgi:acyl-CoA dehydrogenase
VEPTVDNVRQQRLLGESLADLQNTQFKLAECKSLPRWQVGSSIAWCGLLAGEVDAKMETAKLWVTGTEGRVIDECLQLLGEYGYSSNIPLPGSTRTRGRHEFSAARAR